MPYGVQNPRSATMPRTQRLIINDETAVYHVMSRTALDGFPLGDIEKDFMLDLIRRYSSLYLVDFVGLDNACLRLAANKL
jgi:hypothetical protein